MNVYVPYYRIWKETESYRKLVNVKRKSYTVIYKRRVQTMYKIEIKGLWKYEFLIYMLQNRPLPKLFKDLPRNAVIITYSFNIGYPVIFLALIDKEMLILQL